MVIHEKLNVEILCFASDVFSLKFIGIAFVSSSINIASSYDLASAFASLISSHLIIESSIILAKYFPFLQQHVARFQTFAHI